MMKPFNKKKGLFCYFLLIFYNLVYASDQMNLVSTLSNKIEIQNDHLTYILNDILILIINQIKFNFPCDDLICLGRLKSTCNYFWQLIDIEKIASTTFKIPSFCFAAATGNIENMITLKETGYSPLEPDNQGFRAAHYAAALKQGESMQMLKIADAFTENSDSPDKLLLSLLLNSSQSQKERENK